jgi:lipopolysaccharide/colanic/teichoic acid biosynthesis glycosyltransferase
MVKRVFDIIISCVLLVLLAPVFLVISVLNLLVLGWPVFYTQRRPGLNERIFTIIKFRTMSEGRDSSGALLPDVVRTGPFGKFLRTSSLDEIPELWNVLVGDMSLVGPRPLLVEYLDLYSDRQKCRHSMRPGITGLAQISGRIILTWEEKFELDLVYVREQSFFLDLRILFRTIFMVIARVGINQNANTTADKFHGSIKDS